MFENDTGDVVFEFSPIRSYEWTKKTQIANQNPWIISTQYLGDKLPS